LLASVLLALLLGAAWRLPVASQPSHDVAPGAATIAVLLQPAVAWFFAGVFLTVLAHTSLYAFYSLYLASLGFSKGEIGVLWTIGVVAEVAWFWFQGRWLSRWSMHTWLVVAALASALRFALVAAFGASVAVLVFAQGLHALSFAAQHSACIAVIAHHFPGRTRGRGQALYAVLGYGVSGVIGGIAGGALSQVYGFPSVFWAAAVVALAAAWCSRQALRCERQGGCRRAPRPVPGGCRSAPRIRNSSQGPTDAATRGPTLAAMQNSSETRPPAHKARRRLWLGVGGAVVLVGLTAAVVSKTQLFQGGDKDKSKQPVPLEFIAAEVARPVPARLPVTIEFSGPLVAPRRRSCAPRHPARCSR
jgi:Arabinose efflux permease